MPPPLVRRALALADELGFTRSCSEATGRLLHLLAAQRGRLRVGEIGSGCGVGSAWLLSALDPAVPFVTVELDPARAAAVRRLLGEDANARVLTGDWRELLPAEAPFDLLFADSGPTKADPALAGLLARGGTLVLDDLAPEAQADPVRAQWLHDPRVLASELLVSPEEAVLLAVLQ